MNEQTYGGVSQPAGTTGTGTGAGVVKDEVQRIAAEAREETTRVASQAREQASQLAARATAQTTQRLNSLASALRQAGQQLETDDAAGFGRYAGIAADQVEKVSGYLEGKDLGQLVRDTQTFARRHPDLFLGGAFVAGVMLARFIKSSAPETGMEPSAYEPFNPPRFSGIEDDSRLAYSTPGGSFSTPGSSLDNSGTGSGIGSGSGIGTSTGIGGTTSGTGGSNTGGM